MSNVILHIKDAYYFEVPKMLWRSNRKSISDFPDWFVRLDDSFQSSEADDILAALREMSAPSESLDVLKSKWEHWKHEGHGHANAGWPLDAYLDSQLASLNAKAAKWAVRNEPGARDETEAYLAKNASSEDFAWFHRLMSNPQNRTKWQALQGEWNSQQRVDQFASKATWSEDTIAQYNHTLDGKVLIPQPFGTLRNAYEPESGFAISKFMILQVVVAVVVVLLMKWLAGKISSGTAPKGRMWNAMEGVLLFIKEKVIVPAMGEHDADRFLPLLWTLFVFIFGLNLIGMIPWMGSPTAALATSGMLAVVVFAVGITMGVKAFGPVGFLKNICPELGLPWYLSFWVVPLLWVIEFASLFIKHAILAIRLLANMVAGHAVLLGIMGLAVGVHAYALSAGLWYPLAGASAVGMVALSVLELFVAFLQAAVFTFLAALFIGSSMHHH